jgi:hypothetical protein
VSGSNNQVLTSNGSGGIVAESNLTFDGSFLFISGNSQQYGIQYNQSGIVSGITTDTLLNRILTSSGSSAVFDYYVRNTSTQGMRSGQIIAVWDQSTNATWVDYSTPDLNASTLPVKFKVENNGTFVSLTAVIGSGTWNIGASSRVTF